ncbi:MAG: hypothetical protein K2Q10_07410, partial [Rhodospirillales bacterium]|nr:hypothetical protein [Rhodospirillales bacterium]
MRRNLRALLAGCLVIPLALFAVFAVQGYQQTLRTGEERVRRNAELMEEHVARVLETHAVIIRSVRERIRDLDHETIRESRELNLFLREQLIDPAVVFAL